MECLWDEGRGDGDGGRTLTIAGTGVIVDVEFRGEVVEGVVLQFEGSRESVKEGAAAGAEVLRRDLRGDGETGYVSLDGFVNNLERLATMDRLGGGGVSCFDAVDGLYRSLEKVFTWETGKVKELKIESVEENVLCRQSGRPRLHTKGRVGLSLQYWMERRLLAEKQPGPDAMDVDTATTVNEDEQDEPSIWSAIIECEASSAALYTSIKVSNDWVSEAVEKPAPTQDNGLPIDDSPIDWQEPPPTLLAPESPKNQTDVNRDPLLTHPKLPDVRFVARFEPPVIVPLQLAIDIHESVGSPLAQESLLPTTYENLLFEDIDTKNQLIPNPRILEKTITTYNPPTTSFSTHKHKYTLFTQPQDYARAITNLPFTHPRQILVLLPTLRQWALAGSLLRRSFAPATSDTTAPPTHTNGHPTPTPQPTALSIEAALANFLSTPLTPPPSSPHTASHSFPHSTRDIQITLTTHPLPRLSLHFPNPHQNGKLASIGFNIGLNGIIDGVDVDDGRAAWQGNGSGSGGDLEGVGSLRERVRRVMEIGEDAGIGVEWLVRG
ncbi:hypothetical protein N7G274_002357 [Stereocaulon virgatum]|uniref:Mediator of RNA polymerase II transcription subunit 1 n=1 Tax=Stereocaulon virgatum TaxID=373712 RepID=A0ABR4AKS1_9LECA